PIKIPRTSKGLPPRPQGIPVGGCCDTERSPRLSSHNVAAVDPDSLTVAPYPMSRPPDVIAPAHIITRAAIIIGSITNLDRDSAWVRAIARATSVTGSITTLIIWSVTRERAAILIFASD